MYYNISIWYKLADKTIWGAWIAGIGTVITVVLSFILIRKMGVIGSAWTALACYFFMVVSAYFLGQKYYAIPFKIMRMFMWVLLAVGIYFLMERLRHFYEDNLSIILLINTMLIAIFCFLVLVFEKALLRQLLKKAQ
jgi:hypothetical protein